MGIGAGERDLSAMLMFRIGIWMGAAMLAASSVAAPADQAAERFKPYVLTQVAHCLVAIRDLRTHVAAHDLVGSQHAWLAARGGWEASEIVTSEFFPELDRAIDGWPDAQSGFHAIEAKLFGAHNVDVLPAVDELVGNVAEIEKRLRATSLTEQGLLNGTARLVYEIGEDKAGGGESPFSGNSIVEIGNNADAISAVYRAVYAPALARKDAVFAGTLAHDLTRLHVLVAVGNLQKLDQLQLRNVSETLTSDFVELALRTGLDKPRLGN